MAGRYRNVKIEMDGFVFDSKGEAGRYVELLAKLTRGEISNLEVHPTFELVIGVFRIGRYTADFRYRVVATGDVVVEDYKSRATMTRDYALRKKLMKALHGINVVEVGLPARKKRGKKSG